MRNNNSRLQAFLFVSVLILSISAPAVARAAARLYWFMPCGLRAEPVDFDLFKFAAEGKYPNIKKMMDSGSYGYSIPTYPGHTPTNFATLVTGAYPEVHGIVDGPMRLEGQPLSKPSMSGFSSLAKLAPPVWSVLERAGKKVAIISVPGSTPPELDSGVTIRGRWGNWGADFFGLNFETDPADGPIGRDRRDNRLFYSGPVMTHLLKPLPPSEWKEAPASYSKPREIEMSGHGTSVFAYIYDPSDDGSANYSKVLFSLDKAEPLCTLSSPNEWSDWMPVTLKWKGLPIDTQMRICLVKLDPNGFARVRIVYNMLNRTIMEPGLLAEDILSKVGPMIDFPDNWPAQLNRYPEDKAVFLTETLMALDWHRKIVPYLYQAQKPDVVFHNTYVPNQMLESRWWLRYLDRTSPDYNRVGEAERKKAWDDVHLMLKGIDDILGEAMKGAGSDAIIVLSSDHGAVPIKKYVLINNFLKKNGLLTFYVDEATHESKVNWTKTRAIHLQMHGIYLGAKGLEGNWTRGSDAAFEQLRTQTVEALKTLKDADGVSPFDDIVLQGDAKKLRLLKDRTADLILVMKPGYALTEEMSEDLALFRDPLQSGYKQALTADKTYQLWTPFIVMGPGVRKGHRIKDPIRHVDQAPTLLKLMGVSAPKKMQGEIIREILEN